MFDAAAKPPKVFISYSWTTPEHQARVMKLAEDLVGSGVDVILDKWSLLHGNDTHAFMQQANDPSVDRVAMIFDRKYVEKANSREGGVGIEAQIITPGIYESHDQTKYVGLVMELDDKGKPVKPTYYGSKRYIDFTDPTNEASAFEELLRWIYDKPRNVKPSLGKRPAFLDEGDRAVQLATGPAQRRAVDALRNGRAHALPALKEYFETFKTELENFRIPFRQGDTDDVFMANIEAFVPYRNEMIEVFVTVSTYADTPEFREAVHDFFGSLIRYQDRIEGINNYRDIDFDNFKFFINELFLYCIASYLKAGSYDAVTYMCERDYYVGDANYNNRDMIPYRVFRQYVKSFELRNHRLKLNRAMLQADVMKERCKGVPIDFLQLMTADFVLFLRGAIVFKGDFGWFPVSCVYLGGVYRTLEMFARSRSAAFFERIKPMFGVSDATNFRAEVARIEGDRQMLPRWGYDALEISRLVKPDEIATTP